MLVQSQVAGIEKERLWVYLNAMSLLTFNPSHANVWGSERISISLSTFVIWKQTREFWSYKWPCNRQALSFCNCSFPRKKQWPSVLHLFDRWREWDYFTNDNQLMLVIFGSTWIDILKKAAVWRLDKTAERLLSDFSQLWSFEIQHVPYHNSI